MSCRKEKGPEPQAAHRKQKIGELINQTYESKRGANRRCKPEAPLQLFELKGCVSLVALLKKTPLLKG